MSQIKFGTDGWRAIIADDYTFASLARVTRATLEWLQDEFGANPKVVVGHDARFQGRAFAEHAARVLANGGAQVVFGDTLTSTPALSWATLEEAANAGIVITASHNPPAYNGFKIKAHFGGPAPPETISRVEELLRDEEVDMSNIAPFDSLVEDGSVTLRDIRADYMHILRDRIDVDAIKRSDILIAHDAMYGAGMGLVSELVGSERVIELHSEFNPSFKGVAPEPIERNCQELSETIKREHCNVGLANDGDADRIGMFDEEGRFVSSHKVLALLVKYLHEERGLSGSVIKTFSTTHLLDRMGERYGLDVETTPIGFKYIAPKMVEQDVLVGGEESGGIAAKGHIPERDGIYIGLLLVEMMVKRGMKLSELVDELRDEFGPHHTFRDDIHTTDEQKANVLAKLDAGGGLSEINGHPVSRVETLDGFKHVTDAGWLLIRPSGTEPVLRVYSEAETADAARSLVKDASLQLGLNDSH